MKERGLRYKPATGFRVAAKPELEEASDVVARRVAAVAQDAEAMAAMAVGGDGVSHGSLQSGN